LGQGGGKIVGEEEGSRNETSGVFPTDHIEGSKALVLKLLSCNKWRPTRFGNQSAARNQMKKDGPLPTVGEIDKRKVG